MSRFDTLVTELCPSGVEHLPLGRVAFYSGRRVDASALDETNFVGVDNLLSNAAGKTIASYLPNSARLTAYEVGDILIGNIRPYLRKVWLATNDGGCSGDVLAVRIDKSFASQLDPVFLYYVLSSEGFFAYNMRHAKGAKMPRGSKAAILKYRIPIPPLAIQREIVTLLNNFTHLEAELEAELEARRRQYTHYRDALLSFAEHKQASGTRWVQLSEVGTLTRGRRFTNKDFVERGIPCIHYGEIYTHYGLSASEAKSHVRTALAKALRFALPGDLVIAGTGENVEEVCKAVAWLGESEVAVHDDCYIYHHSLNPKYAAHYFRSSHFNEQKVKYAAGAKMIRVSSESLGKIRVPVPPLEEQERIVGILDRFDALVNDISIGLPAELRARRQQYEYYRDRLLTFKEAA